MNEPMFDLPDLKRAPTPEVHRASLSQQQRRTLRQYDALMDGQHPLSIPLGAPLPLHSDAAPADDPQGAGLRCGGCVFRQLVGREGRSHPKCARPGMPVTHGPSTDCRAWWPGCLHHQPKEEPS
jgi:hypothetical protein